MDIYSYLNSLNIEAHCRKIRHPFSGIESAFLVWKSDHHSIEEKHRAYREIIASSGDETILLDRRGEDRPFALRDFLNRYMEIENRLLRLFCETSPLSSYFYRVYWDGGKRDTDRGLYATLDDCICALSADWEDEDHVIKTIVSKQWHRSKEYPEGKALWVQLMPDYCMGLTGICSGSCSAFLTEEEADIFDFFDRFWLYVPAPFQKGDIVYDAVSGRPEPFLLEGLCYQKIDREHLDRLKKHGDLTDMTAYGYFLTEDGRLYYECMHDYLSLQYYTEPLAGKARILKPVSNYMKNEIDFLLLLNACIIIAGEERIGDYRNHLCVTDEELRLAGLLETEEDADEI